MIIPHFGQRELRQQYPDPIGHCKMVLSLSRALSLPHGHWYRRNWFFVPLRRGQPMHRIPTEPEHR